jgi:hypothetical protein
MPVSKRGDQELQPVRLPSHVSPPQCYHFLSSRVSLVVVPAEHMHLLVTVLSLLVDTWNPTLVHNVRRHLY